MRSHYASDDSESQPDSEPEPEPEPKNHRQRQLARLSSVSTREANFYFKVSKIIRGTFKRHEHNNLVISLYSRILYRKTAAYGTLNKLNQIKIALIDKF